MASASVVILKPNHAHYSEVFQRSVCCVKRFVHRLVSEHGPGDVDHETTPLIMHARQTDSHTSTQVGLLSKPLLDRFASTVGGLCCRPSTSASTLHNDDTGPYQRNVQAVYHCSTRDSVSPDGTER